MLRLAGAAVLIALAVAGYLFAGAANAVLKPVDDYTEGSLLVQATKAGIVFLSSRGLSGVVAVVQNTTISVSLFVGTNISIGQVLAPFRDILDKFSDVLLIATLSLGLQALIFELGSKIFFTLLLPLAFICHGLGLAAGKEGMLGGRLLEIGRFSLISALILRFFIPLTCFVGESFDRYLLQSRYDVAEKSIKELGSQAEQVLAKGKSEPRKAADWIVSFKDKANQMVSDVIDLIMIFLVQTILLPLLVLWGLKRLLTLRS